MLVRWLILATIAALVHTLPPHMPTPTSSEAPGATVTAAMNETELLRFHADAADKEIFHLQPFAFENQTIRAGGDWLVFVGSQTCPHCQKLTPMFLALQKNMSAEYEKLGLRTAKLSCSQHKELCNNLIPKLEFYPSLRIYQDGVFHEEFDGEDEIVPIKTFVQKYLDSVHGEAAMAVKKAKVIAAGSAISDPASTNSDGISFVLTPDNIAEKLEEGAWFIKFYSPMCGHCKMFAPTWIEIATKLKGIIKVGEVDCLQHMSVCTQYDIQLFPTVKYIGGGREEMFKGSRTLDNLIKFATGFMNVAFNAVSKDQVNSILHSESSVSFFYLYDYNRTSLKLVENFAKVASSVSNTIQVNVCPDPTALALFPTVKPSTHYPILLVSQGDKDSKDAHIFQASLELSTESSRLNAKNWILKHSKPLLQKLQESTSRAIMDGKNVVALGVIKSSDNDTASVATKLAVVDVLRSAARKWQNGGDGDSHDDEVSLVSGDRDNKPSVVFAWIDAKEKADYLRRAFAIDVATAEFPQFLIVDTKADLFYDTDEDSVNKLSFKSADAVLENLDAIFNGKLKGKIANGSTGIFKGLYRASKPFAAFMKLHPIFSFTILIGIIVGLIRCALVDSVDYRPLGRVEPKAD